MTTGAADPPRLSVVIPAFNEAARIGRTLEKAREVLAAQSWPADVLVVVDGSADCTAEIVASYAAAPSTVSVRLFDQTVNRGKGFCVRRGMLEARGRVRLYCDADLSTPIEMAPRFVEAIAAGADIVIASRRLEASTFEQRQPWVRERLGLVFSSVVSRVLLPHITDSQCGFKAFTAEAAEAVFGRQQIDEFCFDVEVLVIARQLGLRVVEFPVPWTDDPRSRVRPFRDGVRMLRDLTRIHRRLRQGEYETGT